MIDWMTKMVDEAGSIGIALLMLLENVFPPIPSELIMPLGALPRRVVIILPPVDGTGGAL